MKSNDLPIAEKSGDCTDQIHNKTKQTTTFATHDDLKFFVPTRRPKPPTIWDWSAILFVYIWVRATAVHCTAARRGNGRFPREGGALPSREVCALLFPQEEEVRVPTGPWQLS